MITLKIECSSIWVKQNFDSHFPDLETWAFNSKNLSYHICLKNIRLKNLLQFQNVLQDYVQPGAKEPPYKSQRKLKEKTRIL